MNIKSALKNDGIEVTEELDTLMINSISKNIAHRIVSAFPDFKFDESDLFIRLSRISMYKASIKEGMAEANYFYKNNSIYFNKEIPNEELEEYAIHECIHYLQEVKDKRNNLISMGLCNFTGIHMKGIGLNEAAVQYLTAKILGIEPEGVKYYGIEFNSISPSFYPIECKLLEQMVYIVGENLLINSTFNSNNKFKERFCDLTSTETFDTIQVAMDDILSLEEKVIKLNYKLQKLDENSNKINNIMKKIELTREKIKVLFFRVQNLIFTKYFNSQFKKITTFEEVNEYRSQLEQYKYLIGTAENYTYFNDYYIQKISSLAHRNNVIEHGGLETALVFKKTNKILKLLQKLLVSRGRSF